MAEGEAPAETHRAWVEEASSAAKEPPPPAAAAAAGAAAAAKVGRARPATLQQIRFVGTLISKGAFIDEESKRFRKTKNLSQVIGGGSQCFPYVQGIKQKVLRGLAGRLHT